MKSQLKIFQYYKLCYIPLTAFFISNHVAAQLSGTLNIPGAYASLASAIADLNAQGVGPGGVTLNLLAGNPETAPAGGYVIGNTGSQILITSSMTKPIIIQGNGNTITASAAHTIGDLNDAIFKIIGADWVTLRDFTMIENPGNIISVPASNTMTEWGVALLYVTTTDGAQNNTIEDNTIDLDRTYSNTFGIYSNSTHSLIAPLVVASATTTAGGNSGLKIYSNTITDVNQGIVVVGPTAAADHNIGLEIGATAPNANTLSNYGTSGTFSTYANVSTTVNGILVRNTKSFNISFNSVSSSNGGTVSGTLYGIYVPSFTNAPTGTFTNSINNNNISIRSAVATGAMNSILLEATTASSTSILNINNNDFNTITHTVAASGAISLISNAGPAFTLNVNNNTFTNLSVNTTGAVTFISNIYSIPASGSKTINNNSIVTAFNKTGAGNALTCMKNTIFSPIGTIATYNNNNFSNITVTGATDINGLIDDGSGDSAAKIVMGNTFNSWTGGTGTITAMSVGSAGGPNSSISNNTVTNISGQSSISGISIGSSISGATLLDISSNTLTGLTSTGSGGAVTGISCSNNSATVNINNNNVQTLSSTGASSTVSGMIVSGLNTNVFSNTIHGLSGSGATAPVANGITINSGTVVNVYKNKIYDILESGTTGSIVNGISLSAGGSAGGISIYNNLVGDLRTPASTSTNAIRGISITATTTLSNYNISDNTVYINATSSGVNFGTSGIFHTASATSTTATLNLRNNIVVNLSTPGTGKTVAFRRSTGTAGTLANYGSASNNNLFYAGTPGVNNLIYSDGTSSATTLTAYKNGVFTAGTIGPRDGASITEVVSSTPGVFFLSLTGSDADFLHIVNGLSTQVENGGLFVAGISDDYDGNGRVVTFNDIGADEFTGVAVDMVGPIINYTSLPNTVCLENPSIVATILDPGGVNVTVGTKPRIWYKKSTDSNILPATNDNTTSGWKYTEATNASSPFSFIIDYALISGGAPAGSVIQYFIGAQDNSGTPNLAINFGLFTTVPPTVALNAGAFPVTTTNSYTLLSAIPTTITVGTGGTYTTLTGSGGLFADLNTKGLSGNTTVTLISTTITETNANALNNILYGCGGPFTLTIKPGTTTTLTGSVSSAPLIKLNGADNVIIDGSNSGGTDQSLTITNTSTSSPSALHLISTGNNAGASHNTIKNCILNTGSNAETSNGILIFGANNDFNTIQNNTITKCYYGIRSFGNSPAEQFGNNNLIITGNTIGPASSGTSNIRNHGIEIQNTLNVTINANTIQNILSAVITDNPVAINLLSGSNIIISGNNIHDIYASEITNSSGIVSGILLNTVSMVSIYNNTIKEVADISTGINGGYDANGIRISQTSSGINVYNNMISDLYNPQVGVVMTTVGISITGSPADIKVDHNSINLFGNHAGWLPNTTGGGAACIYVNSSGTNIDIRDNLLTNSYNNTTSSGDKSYAIFSTGNTNTQFSPPMDYNDYFVSGAPGILGNINSIDRITLADIQSGFGGNTHSQNISPVYTSSTDLHLPPASNVPLDNLGVAIPGIFTDFDVLPRNIITPDMGADEFSNGCNAKVTTTADSGAGSLRDMIACAVDGDPVTFDASLIGQTITLTSGEISINKNIGIFGPGGISDITISGGGTSRIFNVAVTKQLHLHNLSLKDGFRNSDGGALYLEGNLLVRNVLFQNNLQGMAHKALTVIPGSTITVYNEVDMNQ